MDMSNVKAIFDNNVQKNVKKITDANGNIIWYKVPDEYRKVEYLEGSGTQYIDTGWINNQRAVHSYKMKFQALALTEGGLFGPLTDQSALVRPGTLWLSVSRRAFRMSIGTDNSAVSKNSYAYDTNIHTFTNEINESDRTYRATFDNKESYKTYAGTVYSEYSTCLFRSSISSYHPVSARIFYFIICKNGQEVRYFIPVVRNADDKPGMYDLVNDVFYTNAGTGEFGYRESDTGIVVQPT